MTTPIEVLSAARPYGYALWVGAGTGLQLTSGTGHSPLLWKNFVEYLEDRFHVAPHPDGASFPDRLEACFRTMGRYKFQVNLRQAFLEPVAEGVLTAARAEGATVPRPVRQLSNLGRFANPIVNFNVEHLTSRALAAAHGPMALRVFTPLVPGGVSSLFRFEARLESVDVDVRFRRSVYHPHGAIHSGGMCVMTSSQYAALNGTLGLELAVHLAFDQSLLIVGMSLDDAYLRDQILRFRSHIRNIYWFGAEDEAALKPEIRKWVWDTDIKRIKVQDNWLDFWEASEMRLERNGAPEPLNLLVAWHNIVLESMALLSKPKWSWLELLRQHSNLAVEAATEAALSALNSGENPNEADREDLATQEQIDAVLLPIRQEIERLANRPWRNIVTAAGNIELR